MQSRWPLLALLLPDLAAHQYRFCRRPRSQIDCLAVSPQRHGSGALSLRNLRRRNPCPANGASEPARTRQLGSSKRVFDAIFRGFFSRTHVLQGLARQTAKKRAGESASASHSSSSSKEVDLSITDVMAWRMRGHTGSARHSPCPPSSPSTSPLNSSQTNTVLQLARPCHPPNTAKSMRARLYQEHQLLIMMLNVGLRSILGSRMQERGTNLRPCRPEALRPDARSGFVCGRVR